MRKNTFLNETTVLDTLTNLSKLEKSALKVLHSRFKHVKYEFDMPMNKLIDILEDDLDFNFTTSLKIAKIYRTKRDFLFKDIDLEEENSIEIILHLLNKFISLKYMVEIEELIKKKIVDGNITKQYGKENFFFSPYIGSVDKKIELYVDFEPYNFKGRQLNREEMKSKQWAARFGFDYLGLEEMFNKGVKEIDYIPFNLNIHGIKGNFPLPDLENHTEVVKIPINFDINNPTKNDLLDVIIGDNNSLLSHLEDIVLKILGLVKD